MTDEQKKKIGESLKGFAKSLIPLVTTLIGSLLGILIGGDGNNVKLGALFGAAVGGCLV